jgi:hypothetical protein
LHRRQASAWRPAGNRYNYSGVKEIDIQNVNSKISIISNSCLYAWTTTIRSHINDKANCPECTGHFNNRGLCLLSSTPIYIYVRWDYQRFLRKAKMVHGDKYNYDKVNPDHIHERRSKVSIYCNTFFMSGPRK